jgi:hypothetical protein
MAMEKGKTMTRRAFALGRQIAAFAALAVLALSLSGDRTSAAGVPAPVYGQDPLEVLELKVRPNVIIVLDSSGSMQWLVNENDYAQSGDHPRSKLYQAKQVLKQAVQNNQNKVSFQMGTYTQYGLDFVDSAAGRNRFQYVVSSTDAPFMTDSAKELTAERANGDSSGSDRGLQSWQIIDTKWGTLYFSETNGAQCTATIPGTPKFYAQGGSGTSPATSTSPQNLAFDLQTAMNAATCSGASRANTYAVSYNTGSGVFTFAATGPNRFNLLPNATPNNIRQALGGLPTTQGTPGGAATTITLSGVTRLRRRTTYSRVYLPSNPGVSNGDTCTISGAVPTYFNGTWTVTAPYGSGYFQLSGPTGSDTDATTIGTITCSVGGGSGVPISSSAPYTLLYRTTGTGSSNSLASPFSSGMDTRWSFSETIDGTNVNFYHVATSRLWNGEVIRVKSTGEVCGMDFATAATKTDPPSVTLVSADSNCNPGTDRAVFTYAGIQEGSNSRSCNGFRSKSQLIPCDLQSPPAAMQFTTIEPPGTPRTGTATGTRTTRRRRTGAGRAAT